AIKLTFTSIVYYKNINASGQEEWLEYQRLDSPEQNRIWVDWANIDKNLQNAFVAIEDQTFWTHGGVNYKRTIYAMLNEVAKKLTGSYLRGTQQGASTINQQLIKNLTGDDEDTGTASYLRKFREIFRALALHNRFSKDTIFEAYLNTISLTGNIGGVQAGANRYFNKHVGEADCIEHGEQPLTIAECASIAAITKNPTSFSPISNPEQHLVRRNKVITNMFEQGYITAEQRDEALATPLKLYETVVAEDAAKQSNNSYFTDTLINYLVKDYMTQNNVDKPTALNWVYNSGLRIYATVVPTLQTEAEDVFNRGEYWNPDPIENYQPKDNKGNIILNADGTEPEPKTITTNAAGAIINYKGELCAVVGGLGAKTADRTLNRAVDSLRAVGSTMKGVAVYPLAIEYDLATFSKTQIDTPLKDPVIGDDGKPKTGWPRNYNPGYTNSAMTTWEAVKDSVNTIAVWFGKLVGPNEMYTFAHDTLEISSLVNDDRDLAPMVLGALTHGMSPYALAGAYMMYGNGGQFYSLHTYTSVEDSTGKEVMKPDVNRVQAISEDTAFIMNRLLREVMVSGTGVGMSADKAGMDSIGKTGTTNENKDIWFVGLTPYYVSSFWYGYDENEPMKHYVAGSRRHPGLRAWQEIMNTEQADA
ncbi:MAG: transglycosylase domain-containing protein, partial [Ruthenibacterium sp.]